MEQYKDINILFLGGAKRVSLAEKFIDEGKKRGIKISIFSYELTDEVPIAFVGKIIPGLKWNDVDIYQHLNKVVEEHKINIIIPFLDFATIIAARLKEKLKDKNIFIPVSDENNCEIFFNKILADNWCKNNDINVPSDLSNFPLIAKPVTGSASKGIIIIASEEEYNKLANKENYLIQKFINGKEYSVDIYISTKDKEIISIVPRERLETQGGESIRSKTIKESYFIKFAQNIIKKTNLEGPVTLQFIEDNKTKELYFLEINPRFGGAVLNSIFAGANSPSFLLNDYLNIKNTYTEDWLDQFLMIRRFSEYYKICK